MASHVNTVGWFEIYVNDMNRARGFYEKVFAVELSNMSDDAMEYWAFPSAPDQYGAGGALAKMQGYPAGHNSTIVYFSCMDCAVELQRAAAHGGHIQKEKTAIGEHGFIALVTDTEGNVIGLHSMS